MLLILLVDAIEQNNKQHSLRSLGKSIADRSAFPVIVGVRQFNKLGVKLDNGEYRSVSNHG